MASLLGEPKRQGESPKSYLEALVKEILELVGHTKVKLSGKAPSCWATNSEDVTVAMAVTKAAGASIGDGITRLTLLYKINPGEEASASMAKEMSGFCNEMVSSLLVAISVGACDPLVEFMCTGVRAVLHSLREVALAIVQGRLGELNSLTGVVWAASQELQRIPKTNKLACRRQIMQWSLAIKDTVDEFQAKAVSSRNASTAETNLDPRPPPAASDNPASASDSNTTVDQLSDLLAHGGNVSLSEGGFADLDGFDDEDQYDEDQLKCVDDAIELLRMARRCLRLANDELNSLEDPPMPPSIATVAQGGSGGTSDPGWEGRAGEEGGRGMAWAHGVQTAVGSIYESSVELGMALYPPLESADLLSTYGSLEEYVSTFMNLLSVGRGEEGGYGVQKKFMLDKVAKAKLGVLTLAEEGVA
ncbi:unnamed protein product [Choristocarpus tenellus]